MSALLQGAASLFKGAADTQVDLGKTESAERQNTANNVQKATANAVDNLGATVRQGISERGATDRANASEAAATNRAAMSEAGANARNQASLDAQFITLTPQLKKGAKEVTGDHSWDEIPDGFKMRADVYSGLLSAGVNMAKQNAPQVFEIQEGNQTYTAEYDPKTRQLRKLTAGGNKWDPDKMDGKKDTAALNPFTLQNIVRQDEKTLLQQTGGKGAKGIPQQGEFGAMMSKITSGKLGELSDTEKTKIAALKSLATRLQNNYTNLNKLESERGLQTSTPDPQIMETINAITSLGSKPTTPQGAAGSKVLMVAPNGQTGYIPVDKVQEALKRGFKRSGG